MVLLNKLALLRDRLILSNDVAFARPTQRTKRMSAIELLVVLWL